MFSSFLSSPICDTTPRGVLTFQTSLLSAAQKHIAARPGRGERAREKENLNGFEIRPDLIGINGVTNVRVSDAGGG